MNKIALSFVIFAIFISTASADQVDDFIQAQMQKQKIPGVSLTIVRDGRVVIAKGYGLADVENNVAAVPETIYQSGSVGKQFTATLVMMLAEEGKIKLDDLVSTYISDAPAAWKNITIHHLLTHTSGILDYTEKDVDFRRDYTEDQLLRVLEALPLQFNPGEKWSYSNSGYMLLGFLIHKVSGKFYGDLLKERVFGPIGMSSARIISEADIVPHRAAGYQLVNGQLKNQDWVAPSINTTADGSLYLSVLDLAKWDAALYGTSLLKKESLDKMWTPVRLNSGITYPYGFGWWLEYQRGHKLIEHSGHWQGFSTAICRYVNDRLTVIIMANLADVATLQFANNIAGLYQSPLLQPRFLKVKAEEDPKRAQQLKSALSALSGVTADLSQITTGFQTVIDTSWKEDLAKNLKGMKSFDFLGCDKVVPIGIELYGSKVDQYCYYRISSDAGIFYLRFALTADQKIADLSIEAD